MPKILVVDDESIMRDSLKGVLEPKNFTVITANNGMEAVEKIKEKPDLVLLDILMPGMDGFQTLKKIKETAPSMAVVMVTGVAEEDIAMSCVKAGAYDYITKPIDLKHLESVIEVYMIQRTEKKPSDEIEKLTKGTPSGADDESTDGKKVIISKTEGVEKRMCRRFRIPGASGKIKKIGLLDTIKGFSKAYPVLDLSKGGLAFTCSETLKKDQKIIFQLLVPGEPALDLLSIIRRVGQPDSKGDRLCGIQFFPFGKSPDKNPVETLEVLRKLDEKYGG